MQFLKTEHISIAISAIWIVLLNGYRLFLHPIGIDTEQALYAFNTNLNWTIGNGRIISAIIRRMIMPMSFNYDIAVVIIIVGLLISVIGYEYCLKYFGIKNQVSRLLFGLLFVSYPIWAEQNYFVCSAYANLIGFLFAKLYDDEINFGVLADIFLKLVLIVIPFLVGYYVISKLGINLFYQREIDYSGYTNAPSYISGQISWRANSIAECFLAIEKV